jgi:SAM-dependent methyltransferase
MPMSTASGQRAHPASPAGLRRSVELWRAFRLEQTDPDAFYRVQAADSLAQVRRHVDPAGLTVIDVGGGAGYFTEAFRNAGAHCVLVEPESGLAQPSSAPASSPGLTLGREEAELSVRQRHQLAVRPGRLAPGQTVAGDGNRMPFPDQVADLTFSSNVLEHVPDPSRFLDEAVRVTRVGGLIYLSFTVWFSPWGGHETAPWHYLGGHRAARRYTRQNGRPPGNLYGSSLFACHVGQALRLVQRHPEVDIVEAGPRYYPDWMRGVLKLPLVRELATWNLLLVLRRTGRLG